MTQKYDIESLIETFADHAKKTHHDVERQAKEYFSIYGKTHPQHKDNFNLPQALCEICKHINSLRDDVSKIWDHILEIED